MSFSPHSVRWDRPSAFESSVPQSPGVDPDEPHDDTDDGAMVLPLPRLGTTSARLARLERIVMGLPPQEGGADAVLPLHMQLRHAQEIAREALLQKDELAERVRVLQAWATLAEDAKCPVCKGLMWSAIMSLEHHDVLSLKCPICEIAVHHQPKPIRVLASMCMTLISHEAGSVAYGSFMIHDDALNSFFGDADNSHMFLLFQSTNPYLQRNPGTYVQIEPPFCFYSPLVP
ncbi:uncharacterized protein EV420DRAFT_1485396 [Desarmillaria tabescens]|uniref:Uncharacterized protein n=1 Tax=Armillaria tabescens TaxID=1929756 RepID=A0AA39JHJ4_ARMTA|nr:uncharacterized protein EV420DRAFT_1485396 [Desarmillaria tabescens]KAK0442272.1 hypothetical protein EV420DRAFT_1485396 [Desarmillaria tabescens]